MEVIYRHKREEYIEIAREVTEVFFRHNMGREETELFLKWLQNVVCVDIPLTKVQDEIRAKVTTLDLGQEA